MKPLQTVIVVFAIIFVVIQLLLLLDFPLPNWVTSYVNDFLCMPLVLFICLKTVRYGKANPNIKLPLFSILSLTVFYAFFFEVLLPSFHARYTADWLDVLLYFAGSFLFYFLQKNNESSTRNFTSNRNGYT